MRRLQLRQNQCTMTQILPSQAFARSQTSRLPTFGSGPRGTSARCRIRILSSAAPKPLCTNYCSTLKPRRHSATQTRHAQFASVRSAGVEFGLAVAAAILTHGHDHTAVRKAIEDELKSDLFFSETLNDAA